MVRWQNEDPFSERHTVSPVLKETKPYEEPERKYSPEYEYEKTGHTEAGSIPGSIPMSVPDKDGSHKTDNEFFNYLKGRLKDLKDESSGKSIKGYENDMPIVDRCIVPTEGEIPVRQYNIARLHTPFSKRAFGRLQVTNKRVIFRSIGKSQGGTLITENEFSLEEIGGIEIVTDFFFSFVLLLISILAISIVAGVSGLVSGMARSQILCIFMSIIAVAGVIASFMFIRKNHLIRALLYTILLVNIEGASLYSESYNHYSYYNSYSYSYNRGFDTNEFANVFTMVLLAIVAILFIYETFKSAFTEDLRISVKIKSGGDAVLVSRRLGFSAFQGHSKDKTGFMFVKSWTHTTIAIRELGALIDDVKRFGDAGIEKWRV